MNDDLNEFLDGELRRADLDATLRAEADGWERLLRSARRDVPGPAPSWLEGRVMEEVRSLAREEASPWLFRRRTLRVSPMALGLAAAAMLVLAVGPWVMGRPGTGPDGAGTTIAAAAGETVVYVQFVLEAPGATSVAVSGDFNEWDRTLHRLEDVDGDGVWAGRIAIRPGIHEYMFVIDGEEWVTDPRAERYSDDGFGNRNALLAVPGPDRT